MRTEIAIIGAGPAGLMAAISAAQAGAKTAVIEANTSAGRKLLRTGRTRCNLTHSGSVEYFVRAYGPFGRFLRHCLYDFPAEDLRRYFAQYGLGTKLEKDGCVFPVTDRAGDVVRVLVDNVRSHSIRFVFGRRVQDIHKSENGFVSKAGGDSIAACAVIIATGGVTWPHTGSTGDGYRFARAFGHKIIKPKACLERLITVETWPGKLTGIGVENVAIRGTIGGHKFRTIGPMIFTHDGIGGPAVFDLSRLITDFLPNESEPIKVAIDLLPAYQVEELDREIVSVCVKNPRKELAGVLALLLPHSLASYIAGQVTASDSILAGQLQKQQRRHLVEVAKKLPLSIKATGPIAEATVTRGGVSTDEINPRTMESKLCPGLFFAGEVINVDGPCGGYNLQIAFSTGHLAGKMAAEYVQQRRCGTNSD